MKKLLVIDNYDSFTYNLVHIIREHGGFEITVLRNDEILPEEVAGYDRIVFSPGPGIPDEAGYMKEIIRQYASSVKMLGVCLGMQAIGEVFGGHLSNLKTVYHGVATSIYKTAVKDPILNNIPDSFMAGRYHSWVVDETNFPQELDITSRDEEGKVMSVKHKTLPIFGLQFHPESVLTENGKMMLFNFLNL